MKRPDVHLQNYKNVYEYYENHEQSKIYARVAHFALSKVYRPLITTDEGVSDILQEEIRSGTRIVVSPNHLTADDQYVVVSIAEKFKELRPLRGNTIIPTEPSLSNRNGVNGIVLRRAVDGLGSIPTFRQEDLKRQNINITDEENFEMYEDARLMSSNVHVSKLIKGVHFAGFWEGKRNRIDFRRVQELKKGIGHTIIAASEHVKLMLLPIGLYYGGEPEDYDKPQVPNKFTPTVHIGTPFTLETDNCTDLVNSLHPEIQKCVDIAVQESLQI